MSISKTTTLNKLNLLNIRNQWSIAIVKELSKRRGSSASFEPLFRDTKKRMRLKSESLARKKFQHSVNNLLQENLIIERTTLSGCRIYLERLVWELDDAILKSIETATKEAVIGRRQNIKWSTILREVRATLLSYNISLPRKITQILVRYFLIKNQRWKLNGQDELIPSKQSIKKRVVSREEQPDLFT